MLDDGEPLHDIVLRNKIGTNTVSRLVKKYGYITLNSLMKSSYPVSLFNKVFGDSVAADISRKRYLSLNQFEQFKAYMRDSDQKMIQLCKDTSKSYDITWQFNGNLNSPSFSPSLLCNDSYSNPAKAGEPWETKSMETIFKLL